MGVVDPFSVARAAGLELTGKPEGLTLTDGTMELRADFGRMLPRLKQGRLQQELLVKAARAKGIEQPWAIDATAGFGEDSLLLAAAGFTVDLYEQDCNRKGIDDAHGHSLASKTNTWAPFMSAPNRPLLSHMRHGPQHPNAKHRHQSRAHGSDHRITHAPSQRPRFTHLLWSVHHGSSLDSLLITASSSQRRA